MHKFKLEIFDGKPFDNMCNIIHNHIAYHKILDPYDENRLCSDSLLFLFYRFLLKRCHLLILPIFYSVLYSVRSLLLLKSSFYFYTMPFWIYKPFFIRFNNCVIYFSFISFCYFNLSAIIEYALFCYLISDSFSSFFLYYS